MQSELQSSQTEQGPGLVGLQMLHALQQLAGHCVGGCGVTHLPPLHTCPPEQEPQVPPHAPGPQMSVQVTPSPWYPLLHAHP